MPHSPDVVLAPPSISFLLCTRNRADTVRECVRSLLASPRMDFEVIVRDNCSTDDTLGQLRAIVDGRLKIHVAPENQGTLTFYEISKLACGEIVTWMSDEDDFQFSELDSVIESFKRNPYCNVLFGSIVVGAKAQEVRFQDMVSEDTIQACITALSFSGCGGLFVRRSALPNANSFKARTLDDAYALWNYYPIGFFASRCLSRSIVTTSRVVVVQSRFARTTNNWSKASTLGAARLPHYYPESVLDRLASNIVNVFSKPLPLGARIRVVMRLIHQFRLQATSFANPVVHDLLRENYSNETVCDYLRHIEKLSLCSPAGRFAWTMRTLLFSLPPKLLQTQRHWKRLGGI
jgi:hypothetical protein